MGQIDTLITASETLATSQPRITEMQRLQKLHARPFRNASGSAINVFNVVKCTGYDSGTDLGLIVNAVAADFKNIAGIVVAEDGGGETTVANNQTGFVCQEGFVQGLNTSGFTTGDLLWPHASTPGSMQNTPVEGCPPIAFVDNAAAAPNGRIYFRAAGINPVGTLAGSIGARTGFGFAQQVSGHLHELLNASKNFYVFMNRGGCRITQLGLVVAASTTSNGTDFWQVQLRNVTGSVNLLTSAFSSNGSDFSAGVRKNISPNTNQNLLADSVLQLQFTKNGAATDLDDLAFVLDYQPL